MHFRVLWLAEGGFSITVYSEAPLTLLLLLLLLAFYYHHSIHTRYSSAESDDISMVVQCAKKIERILRRDFKAEGNGLGVLLSSVTDKRILQSTRLRIG
jgi:hypothetical protein